MNITYELFEKDGEVFMVPLFIPKIKREIFFWHLPPRMKKFFKKFLNREGKLLVTLYLTPASSFVDWICWFKKTIGIMGIVVWCVDKNKVEVLHKRVVGKRDYGFLYDLIEFYISSFKNIFNIV